MKRIARHSRSVSIVVAVAAVVIATAGSATAAGLITSSQIKNDTISSADIRDDTIRSADVRNHSLVVDDFKPGQIPEGPRGATGATGPGGRPGAPGRDGFGLLTYAHRSERLANGDSVELIATCPPGTFVTGGDAGAFDDVNGAPVGNQVVRNASMAGADGYTAHFDNALTNGDDAQIFVDASCANAEQVVLKPPAAKP
jgi:hypothetical protein